ncbi:MAG: GNAT family N-acetyltransferase [Deltaproteobacteria bacterium]|nr:GNAT family N-acetyltransferase [Deltaproteobacteria bacterium]
MRVIDLPEDKKDLFCLCLEDWSADAKESGPKRRQWLDRGMKHHGLRAKLALDDDGVEGGMIQYGPIEHSHVDGEGLYFIYCIHVHGYKQGRGNFRKRGMGKALLAAAEQDARALGASGMASWGIWLPFWMKASWFKKHGYRKADRQGLAVLLWKPFRDDARPPRWFPKTNKLPAPVPGKVDLTAFSSGWCLAQNLVYERAKRAAAEFGDAVVFREIDTSARSAVAEWGVADEVLLDGEVLQKGPPPSYEAIRKRIARRVARLK